MIELRLNPSELAFRDEVRAFLARELGPDLVTAAAREPGIFVEHAVSKRWQGKLAARGWLVPSWPAEYGGTDWTPVQRYLFESECAAAGAPGVIPLGVGMVAPVIIRFGTEAQKKFYLPRIVSGEDYWCQGYSEPGSGSDLASLKTRADADAADYILNGSKIWTTHAHFANRIFCLVRTGHAGKPQQGISFLLVDLASPGIRIAPITSLGGDHEVNQIFFDDVRVPQANRVGAEGEGWTCAKYLLEFERGGNVAGPRLQRAVRELWRVAGVETDGRGVPLAEDPEVRRRIAELEVDVAALTFSELRLLTRLAKGGSPGGEASVLKIEMSELKQRITECAVALLGPSALIFDRRRPQPMDPADPIAAPHVGPIVPTYLNSRAASIYGGSNEIQRNLVARMLLGL
jgi:acyl-CoA dehydrogenase